MSSSFLILWSGQLISLMGSQLTGFGLSLWIFETTRSPYLMAVAVFCKILPSIYFSLFAGPLLDRWSLRKAFITCDSLLLFVTGLLFLSQLHGTINFWILFPTLFFSGIVESLQSLAFQNSVAHFQKPEFYLRSQGLVSFVENSPAILAPMLGAIAYRSLGLEGILLLDAISFFAALGTATAISFPTAVVIQQVPRHLMAGLQWIFRHPRLVRLQAFFSLSNFFNGMTGGLLAAFVLARFHGQSSSWSAVSCALAIGSTLGSLCLLNWNQRQHLYRWIFIGTAAAAVSGRLLLGVSTSLWICCLGLGGRAFLFPLISGANQTIWLQHVDKHQMGAIFGARRVLGQGAYPFAVYLGAVVNQQTTGLTVFMVAVGALEFLNAGLAFLFFPEARPYSK